MSMVYIVTIKSAPDFAPSLPEMTEAIQECMADHFGIESGVKVEEDEDV